VNHLGPAAEFHRRRDAQATASRSAAFIQSSRRRRGGPAVAGGDSGQASSLFRSEV